MKLIACLVTIALLLSSFAAFADPINAQDIRPLNQSDDVALKAAVVPERSQDPELSKHFRRYDVVKFDRDAAARRVKNRGRMILETSHGNFDLEFAPYDLRSSDYSSQEIGADGVAHKLANAPVTTFRATVKDDPGAQARMSVGADGPEGAIITGTGKYFIEPARGLSKTAQPDEFVFYSFDDVADSDTECGVTLADEVAAQQQVQAASDETQVAAAISNVTPISPMAIVRLATDADGEYVNGLGGSDAARDRILQIMNVVDGIYQVEIGVTFQIVYQNFWPNAATDPYTNAEAGARLDEFKAHWNGRTDGGFGTPRSLAHLWTGIDLTGSTIGIASLSAVCRFPEEAYGLSQRLPLNGASNAATSILTAHEIGHNFSAAHTNQIGRDVPAEFLISCDNSIMESGLGTRTGSSFCTFSRSQIVGHATAYGSCLLSGGTPPANNCTETPITSGVAINASLSNTDCRSQARGNPHFADQYTFNGTMGQQIDITMSQTSGAIDPYLYLIGPNGAVIDQAETSGASSTADARIPEVSSTNFFILPQTGKYTIEATSSAPGQTGNYQIRFTRYNCTLTPSASSFSFPAGGGSANLTISESGSCNLGYSVVPDPGTAGSNWITASPGPITPGTRSFTLNISANASSIGRRSFVLVASSGNVTTGGPTSDIGGLRIPITQAGNGPGCSVTPISIGQTVGGNLDGGDCESPIRGSAGLRADRYTFTASVGQQFAIGLSSLNFDCFLTLIGPNGAVLLNDDDGGGGQNSHIPGGAGMLTAGLPGIYTIEVSSFSANQSGNYSLVLAGTSPNWQPIVLNAVQADLKSWKQSDGHTYVYAKLTFPDAGFLVTNWGTPVRSGNTFTVDTRVERFSGASAQAISNTAQIWDLGVIDPGNYTFNFQNSGTTVKTLPFTVSSTASPPNPIDSAHEFVRWQYKDFLRREPDLPGWAHWEGEITQCSNPAFRIPGEDEAKCVDRKRDNTSAAFFLSPEFQNTGYFVLRVYRGSLGRMPHFGGGFGGTDEFTRDAATVGAGIVVNDALAPNVMNANKQAFVNEFVTRAEFRAIYDVLNNTQYVDKLFETTGVIPTDDERQALIDGLNQVNGFSETRASVLFKVVDGTNTVADGHLEFNTRYGKAFYDAQFNAAFVQMEYFGYLQRDPDPDGYAFWLAKLNFFNDWRTAEMVRAFIVSPEYRSRFGAP